MSNSKTKELSINVNLYVAVKSKGDDNYFIVANRVIPFFKSVESPEDMGLFHNEILTFSEYNLGSHVTKEDISAVLNEEDKQGVIFFKFDRSERSSNQESNFEINEELQAYVLDKVKVSTKDDYIKIDLMDSDSSKRGYIKMLENNKVELKHYFPNDQSESLLSIARTATHPE